MPTSVSSSTSCSPQRRAHTPQVNHHMSTTNFDQTFRSVGYATGSLLHFEPGRSVAHNLKRLPSPQMSHDFATSILLGGNHPQNKFRYLNKSFRRAVGLLNSGDDTAAAAFQERCNAEAGFEQSMMKRKMQDRVTMSQFLPPPAPLGATAAVTATPPHPSRSHTPLGTARHLAASPAAVLPVSALSRPATQLGHRGSEQRSTLLVVVDPVSRVASRPGTDQSRRLPPSRSGTRNVDGTASVTAAASPAPPAPSSPPPSRQSQRSVGKASLHFTPPHLRQRQKTWEEAQEFSLNINGDYETPFVDKDELRSLDNTGFIRNELICFDTREAAKSGLDVNEQFINTLSTLPQSTFSPPKIILMMFKFANVRNLQSTCAMRRIGYPELHEQFSTASKNGIITRVQYQKVLSKYLSAAEMLDSHRIIQCFDRNALGDVDLNMFLIGLQILLDCATPGDTMRYCFTLMDANNKIPRYITRYEVQTLIGYATPSSSGSTGADGGERGAGDDDVRVDVEFEKMYLAIRQMLDEAERYDYMGRMPLKEFLEALNDKVTRSERNSSSGGGGAGSSTAAGSRRERERKGQFMFGNVWQGAPVVAAVHRMSSKKMLYASLAPQHNPGDPHARKASLPGDA